MLLWSYAAPLAHSFSLPRTVRVPLVAGESWADATAPVQAALPALPAALVHVACDGAQVALKDPRVLQWGTGSQACTSSSSSVALAIHDGNLLLPQAVHLVVLLPPDDSEATECELLLNVEVAEALVREPPGLPPHSQLARAALEACLAEAALPAEEVAGLQSALDAGASSAAQKVFASFVHAGGRAEHATATYPAGEALLASARRTAHHVAHLLRADRVAAASTWYRNTDAARGAAAEAAAQARPSTFPIHIVLDNVRSAYNVGSIFRSADTAGVAEVVTCGFTPHPPHPKLAKTGFGAVGQVPTRHFESTAAALQALRGAGVAIAAMETTERSVNYAQLNFPPTGVALILGNEEVGVDTEVLEICDEIIEIPTLGTKNSLNICSAASVVLFEILRQWGALGVTQTDRQEFRIRDTHTAVGRVTKTLNDDTE